jgi:C4-dicarboxylate-specific signal transduction histidine kinase
MPVGDPGRPEPRGLPQITVAAGTFAVVLLVALAFLLYSRAQNSLEERAELQVRDATTLAAQLVDEQTLRFSELVDAHGSHLGTLADQPIRTLTRAQRRLVTDELRNLRDRTRGLRSAALTSMDGRLVLAEPPLPDLVGRSFAYRDWFKGVIEERSPYVSRVFRSVAEGRPKTVTVAALVRSRAGRPIAVLTASLERRTQELVAEFNRTQGLGLVVTDQAGGVVALSGVSSNRLMSLSKDPLVRMALAGKSGTKVDDEEIAGYAPVKSTGWTVSARLPTDVALSDVYDLRSLTIALTGAITLLLAALTTGVIWFQRRTQQLEVAAAKREQAVHLHDGVVQTLTVAQIARQAGDHATADRAVADALDESKRITADLLPGDVGPGDLVRPDDLR